ncbi:MAG: D-2-hydroxyacid dehydrogenase [Candidatus Sumerlaeia bacterium]|nr:D-2-hydroxyacid dehydrogenase [Candidatus Sumerlaeia bacterium]
MPRIVILDGYTMNPGDNPWDPLEALGDLVVHDITHRDQIIERARDADIVLTNKIVMDREILAALPNLKFISILATGFNVVDIQAAREQNIPVSNVPEYSTRSVAQYTLAMILEFCHRIQRHSDAVMEGRWVRSEQFSFWDSPLVELAGKTLGIVGFGRIGQATGRLGHAFGMNILANSRSQSQKTDFPFLWAGLEEIFEQSDFVSLHCPLTDENAGMVNTKLLHRMKPSAHLVNTARGALINEQHLADALHQGRIAGAALDVITKEPMAPDSPLLGVPNLIVTPHIAWATLAARQNLMKATAENIRAFLSGNPINAVN